MKKEVPLRKLSKLQLMEMLADQEAEIGRLKKQIQQLEQQAEKRRILIERSGSIAQAALELNGVFEAAQRAADDYLANVQANADAQPEGIV